MADMHIKLLRNKNLYETHDAALAGIKAKLVSLNDGECCVASYGTNFSTSKSLFGVARNGGYEIFDNDGMTTALTNLIEALDADETGLSINDATLSTHVSVQVTEVDGKITAVVVKEHDIASDSDLQGVKDAIKIDGTATAGSIGEKVAQLDGADTLDGSVKKQIKDAKEAIEGVLEEGDATTLAGLNDRIDGVSNMSSVVSGDKLLSQDANGISSTLTIDIEKQTTGEVTKDYIVLKGVENAEITKVDISALVKDGFLESVTLEKEDTEHTAAEGPYLVFTWNSDAQKTVTWVPVKDLVKIYSGDETTIHLDGNTFSIASTVKNTINSAVQTVSAGAQDDYVTVTPIKTGTTVSLATSVTYGTFDDEGAMATEGVAKVSDVAEALEGAISAATNALTEVYVKDGEGSTKVYEADGLKITQKATGSTTQKISLNIAPTSKTDNALEILDNALYLSSTWDCGEY